MCLFLFSTASFRKEGVREWLCHFKRISCLAVSSLLSAESKPDKRADTSQQDEEVKPVEPVRPAEQVKPKKPVGAVSLFGGVDLFGASKSPPSSAVTAKPQVRAKPKG